MILVVNPVGPNLPAGFFIALVKMQECYLSRKHIRRINFALATVAMVKLIDELIIGVSFYEIPYSLYDYSGTAWL